MSIKKISLKNKVRRRQKYIDELIYENIRIWEKNNINDNESEKLLIFIIIHVIINCTKEYIKP